MIIRKALAEDFELIYPLLQEFNNPYIGKNMFRQLFVDHWNGEENYCGFTMIDKEKAVGFLGLIFSKRIMNKKTYRFCNMTSWIVRENYRSKSIFLLLPVLKLKNYIITDLTASKEVYALLHKANFKDFETHYRIIFPIINFKQLWDRPKMIYNEKQIEKMLETDCLKIYCDHRFFQCNHLLIKSDSGICYLVVSKLKRKKPPFVFAQIHYISNLSVFQRYIRSITLSICLRLGVLVVYADNRYLEGVKILFTKKYRLAQPRVYKSDDYVHSGMDNLYSELTLLNI